MLERRTYDASWLSERLRAFEVRYGVGSASFFRAHQADDGWVEDIPGFERHQWASYYAEWRELTE